VPEVRIWMRQILLIISQVVLVQPTTKLQKRYGREVGMESEKRTLAFRIWQK